VIPRNEIDTVLPTVDEAVELAEEGKAADGYTALLAGLERAREAGEDGEPWAGELVGRWGQRWRQGGRTTRPGVRSRGREATRGGWGRNG
jgi:hypothetical protein